MRYQISMGDTVLRGHGDRDLVVSFIKKHFEANKRKIEIGELGDVWMAMLGDLMSIGTCVLSLRKEETDLDIVVSKYYILVNGEEYDD